MTTEPRQPPTYIAGLDALTGLCRAMRVIPLRDMQHQNEHMQALGPILEPTAYMRGGGPNLHDQRRLIDAARELQRVVEELVARDEAKLRRDAPEFVCPDCGHSHCECDNGPEPG